MNTQGEIEAATGEVFQVRLRPRFELRPPTQPILRIRPFGENVEGLSYFGDDS